jgi:adenylylsulfate kinase
MNLHPNDLVWHSHTINREQREQLHGHKAAVIWFTGLSGSGKSTLAGELEQALYTRKISTCLLDGDNVRHGLCQDLGFSVVDRRENIRRVGEVAGLMLDAGLLVITAFISPQRAEREAVRQRLGDGNFIEIFLDTPLEVCEARDPKGLYQKARAGQIQNFTGIDAEYQAPIAPQLHLHGERPLKELVQEVIQYLENQTIITNS